MTNEIIFDISSNIIKAKNKEANWCKQYGSFDMLLTKCIDVSINSIFVYHNSEKQTKRAVHGLNNINTLNETTIHHKTHICNSKLGRKQSWKVYLHLQK